MRQQLPPPSQLSDSQLNKTKRVNFIDSAKGICILLVLLLHTNLISNYTLGSGMVMLPLYFTVSGMFFKDYGGFLITLVKKINNLIIPFLFFYILSYLLFVSIRIVIGGEIDIPFFTFVTSKVLINVALWFLPTLFWGNVFFLIIYSLSPNIKTLATLALTIGFTTLYICHKGLFLPFYIDSGLCILPYLLLGYIIKNTGILYPNKYDKYNWLTITASVLIATVSFYLGGQPFVGFGTIYIHGNVPAFYIGSVAMVVAVLLLCKNLGDIPGIRYMGRYSIIILGIHLNIQSVISLSLTYLGLLSKTPSFLSNLMLFCAVTGLSVLCIPIFKRWFPQFTAQKELFPTTIYKNQLKKTVRQS